MRLSKKKLFAIVISNSNGCSVLWPVAVEAALSCERLLKVCEFLDSYPS